MANTVRTYSTKAADIKRQRHIIDASGKTLGRLASQIAQLLMGKHKPIFSPSQDTGDFVVVINADKIRITGNKVKQKVYHSHSGYPGGFKTVSMERLMKTDPAQVIERAVHGMLPHTYLSAKMKKRLAVYSGDARPDNMPRAKAAPVKVDKSAEPVPEKA